ncbi:hypothetical protein OG701_04895 [Streptomyces uncialis]|nr:hypothetical protein [Streptomyces uncialis]
MSVPFRIRCCLCARNIPLAGDAHLLDAAWQRRYPALVLDDLQFRLLELLDDAARPLKLAAFPGEHRLRPVETREAVPRFVVVEGCVVVTSERAGDAVEV